MLSALGWKVSGPIGFSPCLIINFLSVKNLEVRVCMSIKLGMVSMWQACHICGSVDNPEW